jgi:hypothetical protein
LSYDSLVRYKHESQTLLASLLSRREQLLDIFSSQSGDIHLTIDHQHRWFLPVK